MRSSQNQDTVSLRLHGSGRRMRVVARPLRRLDRSGAKRTRRIVHGGRAAPRTPPGIAEERNGVVPIATALHRGPASETNGFAPRRQMRGGTGR